MDIVARREQVCDKYGSWPAVPIAGSTAQAAEEPREDLYVKCRREAFRRYGQPAIQ
jgi:hypothetical protein